MVKTYAKTDSKQLSTNFRLKEFACKCSRCSTTLLDDTLVEILQKIRNHFGVAVNINSGYRCEEHNAKVGGSTTSHHMRGMAADIRVKGVEPRTVAQYAESIGVKRIGLYEGAKEGNFVHIGSATTKRFWLGHAGTNVDNFGANVVETKPDDVAPVVSKSDLTKGAVVTFTGKKHYSSANGKTPVSCKPGKATITLDPYLKGKHPYHLVAVKGGTSNVYGWVDAEDIYEYNARKKTEGFKPYLVKVTASALNIRKGAGTSYPVVGCIGDKGIYTIVAEDNGWGKLKSGAGWISLAYTKRV